MAATVEIGDIVWAKMPTYPLWPAIVITPVKKITAPYIEDESQHFVKFYGPGTNNCSWIPDKNIFPHSQNLIREARKNKKSKKLQRAIVELEKHLKREGLNVEKQEEEACTKKSYKKRKRNQEAIKAKNKRTKVSGNKEINDTDVVIEDHNLHKNQKGLDNLLVLYHQIKQKGPAGDGFQIPNEDEHANSHKIQDKVDEHPKVLTNTEDNMEIENQHIQHLEIEKVVPVKDCATEKDSTSPEQSIDTTLKLLFSDEILLKEFWKNRSGKKQALQHFLKVIEVLKDEIKKEESLNIQKCDMQLQYQEKEENKDPKLHQIKDKFDEEEKLLKQQGKVTEHSKIHKNKEKEDNNEENNVLCVPEMRAVETISKTLAGELFETTILEEKKENTEPFKKTQGTTSSENEFHENVGISIPITPNDNDKLQLKSSQKGLNMLSDVLLIEPFKEPNELNEKKSLFKKDLPGPTSPIKFGFMGNGILKSSILRNLIKNKLNVTLWIDTSIEANNEAYYASGVNTVKTFKDLIENSDIIFSYWENSKTVKYQMLKVLTSVSTEVFAQKGYVELSTLDPKTAYSCGRAITNHGGRFLEVAVLGDIQAADNGDLFLSASGDQTVFDDCNSSFRAISTFSYYCPGKIGRVV
ncbi:hypothetical protein JTE90_010395 [Oedothorax gibbosus]|uniref:PWWP domain-containing protein n=1 Tax=Oedothorax gibbosus TaxID=931172 RepID=A0AAV6VZN7_9ARAC|nr:hypothetical protein JTE90_010395 [Oedothorax gibbosus]